MQKQKSFISGIVVIPGAAGGEILGGLVPKLLNSRLRGLLTQCIICIALGLALVFQFLLRCDMAKISGISVPYFNRYQILNCLDDFNVSSLLP